MIAAWDRDNAESPSQQDAWILGRVKELADDCVRIAFWQQDKTGKFFPVVGHRSIRVQREDIICTVLHQYVMERLNKFAQVKLTDRKFMKKVSKDKLKEYDISVK